MLFCNIGPYIAIAVSTAGCMASSGLKEYQFASNFSACKVVWFHNESCDRTGKYLYLVMIFFDARDELEMNLVYFPFLSNVKRLNRANENLLIRKLNIFKWLASHRIHRHMALTPYENFEASTRNFIFTVFGIEFHK